MSSKLRLSVVLASVSLMLSGAAAMTRDVTNFRRNTRAYNRAVNHNGTLDRDNDKIACER